MGNNVSIKKNGRQNSDSGYSTTSSTLSRKESTSYDSSMRISFESMKKEKALDLWKIAGRPIRTKDKVIFMSQPQKKSVVAVKNEQKQQEMLQHRHRSLSALPANENVIKMDYYNFKTQNLCKCLEIDTSKYNINIQEASYAIHDESDTLYLINKNRELLAISLSDGTVRKLYDINAENISNAKPKKSLNVATICIYDNKLLILGAVAKKNDDNKVDTQQDHIHKYIPYDVIKNKANEPHLVITNFGKLANVQCMKDSNYLLIMGGTMRCQNNKIYPNNIIRQLKFKENDDDNDSSLNEYEFSELPLYLPETMTSFGCIQLDLDENVRYILLFGGTYVHHRRKKIECSNSVYALYLDKRYEGLNNDEINKLEEQLQNKLMKINQDQKKKKKLLSKNKDLFDIKYHGQWLQLNYELPEKANYYAFYDKSIDKDTIHLLTYQGTHYTISYQEMMSILQKDSILEISDDGKLATGMTCHYLNHPWTESGKNPIPTKIRLGRSRGPKSHRSRSKQSSSRSSSSRHLTKDDIVKQELAKQRNGKSRNSRNSRNGKSKGKSCRAGNNFKIEEKEMDKIDEHEMY